MRDIVIWYIKNLMIAFDRLINSIFGGWCGETLSSRAYRRKWKLRYVIDLLFFWQNEHCYESYLWDKFNKDFPE
ncbi:hypothetical protein FACS18942_04930 [Planctomycetales bacterium]|nr:hypothetical protein FACS18942_04930 [Planctomycetales bacterium]GHT33809.1 hypothetical protein FACS189427_00030 [Planctomycetales bacterium]